MIDRSEAVNLAQHVLEHGSHYPITPHDVQTLAHGVLAMDAALNVNAAVLKMADTAIRESNVAAAGSERAPVKPCNLSPECRREYPNFRAPATTPEELSKRLDEISAEGAAPKEKP